MISLNFETFAAWFISQEVQSAADFPQAFRSTIEAFGEQNYSDDEVWEEMAGSLLGDMRDDLVANFESLIMLTDRADELKEEGTVDEDGMYTLSRLEQDISSWLDHKDMELMLAKAYKAQWEFQVKIMKSHEEAVKARRSQQE